MTKDGRPSRIADIRYFFGDLHTYLKDQRDAVAFGRRIAWYLNGEGFSLGAYLALYIFLTPSLETGAVRVTDHGGDWWQRYTHVGVPVDFPSISDASELVMNGTITALRKIRPDLAEMILGADRIVRAHRDELRFLLKTRETKKYVIEVSCNIAVWPQPSFLFVSLTDRATGAFLEATPIPLQFYLEAFDLAGGIKVTDLTTKVLPNRSVGASLTSARHGGPLEIPLQDFVVKERRPPQSKLVKRRG